MRRRKHVKEKRAFQQELEELFAVRGGYSGEYPDPDEPLFDWDDDEEPDPAPYPSYYDDDRDWDYLDAYEDYYDSNAESVGNYHARRLDAAIAEIQRLHAAIRERDAVIARIRVALDGLGEAKSVPPKPAALPAKTQ